jgi:Flp pilus assembly protein TadD
MTLGLARYRAGDWPGAAAEFEAVIGIVPGSAEAHNNLGACLERMGRLEEALTHYAETVRLAPESADARANLARAAALQKTRRGRD